MLFLCLLLFDFRDVQTDCDLSSTQFDSTVKLFGSTPISSATQQPITADISTLSLDIVSRLPSMRATYLEIAPVSLSTQLPSWYSLSVLLLLTIRNFGIKRKFKLRNKMLHCALFFTRT